MTRTLRKFKVSREIPGSPFFKAGDMRFTPMDGVKEGDIITVAGVYEQTRWEHFMMRISRFFRPVFYRWYVITNYFSNLWDAICGRNNYE